MSAPPYMPFFVGDYIVDAGHLNENEHGAYLRLLCLAWVMPECRIPNDNDWLARKLARSVDVIVSLYRPIISEFWSSDGHWLWQKRQKAEWQHARDIAAKQSNNAKSRWAKGKDTSGGNATAMPIKPKPKGKKEETADAVSKKEPPALQPADTTPPDAELRRAFHEQFWAAYPRKVGGKPAAEAKFITLAKGVGVELILDGLRRYIRHWQENGTDTQYIPYPLSWLNKKRWTDDLSTDIVTQPIKAKREPSSSPLLDAVSKIRMRMTSHGLASGVDETSHDYPEQGYLLQ